MFSLHVNVWKLVSCAHKPLNDLKKSLLEFKPIFIIAISKSTNRQKGQRVLSLNNLELQQKNWKVTFIIVVATVHKTSPYQ